MSSPLHPAPRRALRPGVRLLAAGALLLACNAIAGNDFRLATHGPSGVSAGLARTKAGGPPADLCPGPGATTLSGSVTTIDWCDLGNGEGLTVSSGVTYQTSHRPAITFSGGTVTHVTNRGQVIQDGPDFPIINATATLSGDLTNDGGTFGFINGANTAIQLFAGSSLANLRNVNGGQILGQWEGLNLAGVTFTGAQGIVNDGTISAAGNTGVSLYDVVFAGGAGLANSGTISGNLRGVSVTGTTVIPGGITNSGTISGPPTGYSVLGNYSLTKIDITGSSARFVSDVSASDADVTIKAGSTFANDNAFEVKTFTVEPTARFDFGDGQKTILLRDGVRVSGDFTNAGTVRVVGGAVPLITGHYTQAASGTLQVDAQPLSKLFVSSATLPPAAKIDVVTGDNCAGIAIGQWRSVLYATTLSSAGTFAVTDDCTTMDFIGSASANDLFITAVAPNAAPAAGPVSLAGTAKFGQVLTGSYTYADAEGDAENPSGSGTSYRFVRSTDASVATAGDNADAAAGTTAGAARTYTIVAADLGKFLFYCVTPRAAAGASPGAEACSAAAAAVDKLSQAISFGPAPLLALGGSALLKATGGASGNPVLFSSLTPLACAVSGATVRALAAGTCRVAADQAGDAIHFAAPQATQSIEAFVPPANMTGLWWNAKEAGWGVTVNQQGNTLFATIFTYAPDGEPLWLVAPNAPLGNDGAFAGQLLRTRGPRFDQLPWPGFSVTPAGDMSLVFSGPDRGVLSYSYFDGKASQRVSKPIERLKYQHDVPLCVSTTGSRSPENNAQDLWWDASEPGWGINLAHQGNVIFATLFTYDDQGRDLWLVASNLVRQADGGYEGDLLRTSVAPDFAPAADWKEYAAKSVGTMVIRFADGENARLVYSVNGRTADKRITRMVYGETLPACRY